MKIVIIGPANPYRGGIAVFNERMARAFQGEGHDVELFTFTLQYPQFLFPGKTQFTTEPKPKDLKITRLISSVNPLNWIKSGNKIRKLNPDIVIVKYWLPFLGPCYGTILRRIKKNKSIKIISLIDNMIPHESRIGDRQFSNYFIKPLDGFVAMSDIVMKDILTFDTIKPKLLTPHPLYDNFGERSDREVALKKLGFDPTYSYLLFFGLIRDYKGLDLLIEAFADDRFRDQKIKLIVAGEYYANEQYYTDLIEKNNINNDIIHINEFIPDSEVANYFNACDLVVQPYKSATQSGVTQIAYHFNKAMIVTNVGGLSKMCPDGKVGYVVEPEPGQIADAILKYLNQTDKEVILQNIIEEKKQYSWELFTDKFITFVKNI